MIDGPAPFATELACIGGEGRSHCSAPVACATGAGLGCLATVCRRPKFGPGRRHHRHKGIGRHPGVASSPRPAFGHRGGHAPQPPACVS